MKVNLLTTELDSVIAILAMLSARRIEKLYLDEYPYSYADAKAFREKHHHNVVLAYSKMKEQMRFQTEESK